MQGPPPNVIRVRDLVVGFGDTNVLDHLSLNVFQGEILGLVGGSGSGKSVLLRTIIGLLPKRQGSIEVLGVDRDKASDEELRAMERRWGILFQQGALFSSLTVRENVQFPMRQYLALSETLMNEVAIAKLEMVGLNARDADKFPAELSGAIRDGKLEYFCNTQVTYAVNGVHCKLDILWNYEAPHGDTHYAVYRGDRSAIEVIQKEEQKYIPEAYVVPNDPAQADAVLAAVRARLQAMSADYPGMTAEKDGAQIRIVIPDALRIGHEAHFAEVTHKFLEYIGQPTALPEWETATMLAKYFITTRGVELSRQAN